MNAKFPAGRVRMGRTLLGSAMLTLLLSGCSSPTGYGVDQRAMRTPDGSSGVVAGEAQAVNGTNKAVQSQSTYLGLITQMQHEGQYYASLAHLDTYEARYGRSPESMLLRGDAERLTDQPDLATRSYTALKDTALAGPGYRGLSLLAAARGDFTSAAGLLEQALRFNSTDAVALSDLGYARLRLGDLSGARVPLMTAAQLTPSNPKVVSNLALYLLLDHDMNQSEAVMKSAGVSPQTRQAIYAQASQISHGSVSEAATAAPATQAAAVAPSAAGAVAAAVNAAVPSQRTSALKIDFALASPAPSSDATLASSAH